MANTINQPSNNPTNKLTAATAAVTAWGIVMAIADLALQNLAPTWYDPKTMLLIANGVPTLVCFAAGWFTRDRPNVVVVMQDQKP